MVVLADDAEVPLLCGTRRVKEAELSAASLLELLLLLLLESVDDWTPRTKKVPTKISETIIELLTIMPFLLLREEVLLNLGTPKVTRTIVY